MAFILTERGILHTSLLQMFTGKIINKKSAITKLAQRAQKNKKREKINGFKKTFKRFINGALVPFFDYFQSLLTYFKE